MEMPLSSDHSIINNHPLNITCRLQITLAKSAILQTPTVTQQCVLQAQSHWQEQKARLVSAALSMETTWHVIGRLWSKQARWAVLHLQNVHKCVDIKPNDPWNYLILIKHRNWTVKIIMAQLSLSMAIVYHIPCSLYFFFLMQSRLIIMQMRYDMVSCGSWISAANG